MRLRDCSRKILAVHLYSFVCQVLQLPILPELRQPQRSTPSPSCTVSNSSALNDDRNNADNNYNNDSDNNDNNYGNDKNSDNNQGDSENSENSSNSSNRRTPDR